MPWPVARERRCAKIKLKREKVGTGTRRPERRITKQPIDTGNGLLRKIHILSSPGHIIRVTPWIRLIFKFLISISR